MQGTECSSTKRLKPVSRGKGSASGDTLSGRHVQLSYEDNTVLHTCFRGKHVKSKTNKNWISNTLKHRSRNLEKIAELRGKKEGSQGQTMMIFVVMHVFLITEAQTQNKWTAAANGLITCKHYLLLLKR